MITSKNYILINHGRGQLDELGMFSFSLLQRGTPITIEEYHSVVGILAKIKNDFDLLEQKLVQAERPKHDKFED